MYLACKKLINLQDAQLNIHFLQDLRHMVCYTLHM